MLLAITAGAVTKVLLVILFILLVLMGVLYYFGRKMTKQQQEQQPLIEANTQYFSMLIVDKKKMSIKDAVAAGIPEAVEQQTPFYLKMQKLPVVKAKIGSRMMTLISDPTVFEQLPLRKECKVAVAGIYIREIKSVRGGSIPKVEEKKKGFFAGLRDKAQASIAKSSK